MEDSTLNLETQQTELAKEARICGSTVGRMRQSLHSCLMERGMKICNETGVFYT